MQAFTKQSLIALTAVALLSSCSRPYATFQKTTPEHFYTKVTPAETPAVVAQNAPVAEWPASPTEVAPVTEAVVPATAASADAELQKVDALVSTKTELSTNKKLTRRLNHVREMVSEMRAKEAAPSSQANVAGASSVAPQKMNLMKRLVAKSLDKQIQKKLAPKKTMAKSLLTIGLIIALIGLLLLLIGTGTVASLGYVGLIVGIILIIASLL